MLKLLLWSLVVVLFMAQQSGIFFDDPRLIFGLPIWLAFQGLITILYPALLWLIMRFSWSDDFNKPDNT